MHSNGKKVWATTTADTVSDSHGVIDVVTLLNGSERDERAGAKRPHGRLVGSAWRPAWHIAVHIKNHHVGRRSAMVSLSSNPSMRWINLCLTVLSRERHDGRMHDKPPSTARSSGPQLEQQQRHSSLSSNERRKLRVDELRATAARHSAAAAHKPSSNLKAKQQHVATSLLSPSAPIHGAGFAALSTSSEREDTGLGFTRDVANVDEL